MIRFGFFLLTSILLLPPGLYGISTNDLTLELNLRNHVEVLASDSLEGRSLASEGKERAVKYIIEKFSDIGLKPLNDTFFQEFELSGRPYIFANLKAVNIVGYIEGSDDRLKSEYIVIGAHYDHLGYEIVNGEKVIYPGADDNASGVSVMIELARILSEDSHKIGRSVIFVAFDAEESGLHGSRQFLIDNAEIAPNIKVMFSLDMVGMFSTNNGLGLKGIGSFDRGENIATEIAQSFGIAITNSSGDIEMRTDTWPFGLAGIPAVHVFTGLKSPYHQPGDTYDLLDYEGMAIVTRFMVNLINGVSLMPEISPGKGLESYVSRVRFDYGALIYLGIGGHNYPDEFYDAGNLPNFGGGFFLQIHTGNKLTFQPELIYDYTGSRFPGGNYIKSSLTGILSVQYNIVNQDLGMIRVYPFGGIYYRNGLSGKAGGSSLDFGDTHNRGEFGYRIGFGFDAVSFQAGIVYQRAVTEIFKDYHTTVYQSNAHLTLGYKF